MVTTREFELGRSNTVGKALLWVGTAALVAQIGLFVIRFYDMLVRAGSEALGWLPALGITLMRTVPDAAWHTGAALPFFARMLVSCWPLLLIIAGIYLVKRSANALAAASVETPRVSDRARERSR